MLGAGAVLRAGVREPVPDRRPLIGIVTYGLRSDPRRFTLPAGYVAAVRRAGGRVILVPPGDESAAGVLDLVHGLVLAGGGDLDPRHYGPAAHAEVYGVDPERDRLELDLANELLARPVPTLAICRGLQVVNVALGGDLEQHLPAAVGERVPHRAGVGEPVVHRVRLAPESALAKVCGQTLLLVASMHHQGPKRLGRGLRPVAWADDDTVEAVEGTDYPKLLSVQWHPEETAHEDPTQQRLFDWLVRRAREHTG